MTRPYRGVSADDRRARRRGLLLTACLDLVGAEGIGAVTAAAVSARAGLTKRYFYESFTDRDAVLVAALGTVYDDLRAAVLAGLDRAGPDPYERMRITVELLLESMDDPRVARLYVEAAGHADLRALREQTFHTYVDLVGRDVLGLPDPDPATRAAALVVVAGTTQAVSSWLAGDLALARDALVEEIVALGVGVGRARHRV